MIISHKHKFIFIKCRKTAGTSIEMSLSKICGPEDIITPFNPEDEKKRLDLGIRGAQNYLLPKNEMPLKDWLNFFKKLKQVKKYYNHISAKEVAGLMPDVWNSYFKFTVERNPFDKVVSYYFWRGGHTQHATVADFILGGGIDAMKSYDLYSIDKLPAVDKIYRFEDFDFFEKDFTKQLNLPEPFRMVEYQAKSGHRKVRNYREVLDEQAIDLIKVAFAREIELFEYKY
ncbi:MAG: hypothetical protein ACI85O_001376 [Saprospiraceae bacterium]|jgi:hypothetical protein